MVAFSQRRKYEEDLHSDTSLDTSLLSAAAISSHVPAEISDKFQNMFTVLVNLSSFGLVNAFIDGF